MPRNFNALDTDLTSPMKLRRMLLRCWDTDIGKGSLTPELWHVFVAAATLEMEQRDSVSEYQRQGVLRAMETIWNHRNDPYSKDRWRDLDDALRKAFGVLGGWDHGS